MQIPAEVKMDDRDVPLAKHKQQTRDQLMARHASQSDSAATRGYRSYAAIWAFGSTDPTRARDLHQALRDWPATGDRERIGVRILGVTDPGRKPIQGLQS